MIQADVPVDATNNVNIRANIRLSNENSAYSRICRIPVSKIWALERQMHKK